MGFESSPRSGVTASRCIGGTILLFGMVLFVLLLLFGIRALTVLPVRTMELGGTPPSASDYFREGDAQFASEQELPNGLGLHRISVIQNSTPYTVLLWVRDTVAPSADPVERTVSTRMQPTPDQFLCNLRDESLVKITYRTKPDFSAVGDYTAVIRIEDQGRNSVDVSVPVHVRVAVDTLTVEAGSPIPEAHEFLTDAYPVTEMTPITETMLSNPDTYPLEITADGTTYRTSLQVTDTTPPTASVYQLFVTPDTVLTPMDFLFDITDATAVTASFVTAPDASLRTVQPVELCLKDLGGNETHLTTSALFTPITPKTVEARNGELLASELLPDGDAVFAEPFIADTPGTYALDAVVNGEACLALVHVTDTVAPELQAEDAVWYTDAPKAAEEFLTVLEDETAVTVSYASEPDWSSERPQTVTVRATDLGGNTSEVSFVLTLSPDTEAPKLYGVKDRTLYVNEPISYYLEIHAADNCDEEVSVTVDNSKVDFTKRGKYSVTYTATDAAGNQTKKSCTFTFVPATVSEEEANALAEQVLSEILTDGMSLAEQVEAIYDYVFTHIRYVGDSDKTDWRKEAKRGIEKGKGDCFTYYAVARLLLEQTDAEMMSVKRKSTQTRHYWLLVNVGTGWYHFDACNVGAAEARCFMWTNAQTSAHSHYFWRYEESLYPAVATERYSKETAEALERP